MIIRLPVRFEGPNGDVILYTLFDSGATYSCIHPRYVNAVGQLNKMQTPLNLCTASRDTYLEVNEKILSEFYIHDYRMSDEFLVVPDLTEEAIIGAATLQKWRIKLDFENDEVIINPRVAEMRL